jgi:DNA-binding NarL/FixJ family response regulator
MANHWSGFGQQVELLLRARCGRRCPTGTEGEHDEVLGSYSDGEQALQAVGRHRPEVLVTDIEMPKMSGLELTTRVKDLYRDTRVLILTTFAPPGYLRRALDAGASAYLLKNSPTRSGESAAGPALWIPNWPRRYGARKKTRSPSENV